MPRSPRNRRAGLAAMLGVAATLMAVAVQPAAALEADAKQPVEIEADSMTLDEAGGITEYRGDVRLTQGSIKVRADRLTLFNENGRLARMEIVGTEDRPAVFEQQTDTGVTARGQARRIEYDATESRLILRGNAELRQGPNHIRSQRIDYNTLTNSLLAGGAGRDGDKAPDDGERVEITIEQEQN